ncbi:Phospholipase A I [Arachis hypogaea]|nr:Phospholipase A I [Arachis hypogaea]
MEWWVSMPKVELHAHLNGSIRDSTLLELTKALGEKGVINFSQVEHIIMKSQVRILSHVLIESACSVERVEEVLSTLLPMLPEIQYFRFNPVDERCDMELDETDPTVWMKLESAHEEKLFENIRSKVSKTGESNEGRVLVSILLWNMLSPRIGDYGTCAISLTYNNSFA